MKIGITDAWAEAIGFKCAPEGNMTVGSVLGHVRAAIFEAGFISRGRITSGLKESYRPFNIDDDVLRTAIDGALRLLELSGDVDEFSTSAGRGYAATPARRIDWGDGQVALLGAANGANGNDIVRRIPAGEVVETAPTVLLTEELGRPDWRIALVELNAADAPEAGASALFSLAHTLAAGGDRYSLENSQEVAVLSGRGHFFGKPKMTPSGRWQRPSAWGCFPAVINSGYEPRYVVLRIDEAGATVWQPESHDQWKWIVIGATLNAGDDVLRYEPGSGRLDFLTPPPVQLERAALLTGTQVGIWSWQLDGKAYSVVSGLIGPSH